MSTSRALCCLPLVKKQKHDFSFLFVHCIIKQLLDSVFVISRIIEVSERVISLSLRLRLITPTSSSIILDITKTSSNNCLLSTRWFSVNFFTALQSGAILHNLTFLNFKQFRISPVEALVRQRNTIMLLLFSGNSNGSP